MNYYPHHIGDFDRATRHLTRIERSVYRDLIEVYYDTERPLTLDQKVLCRLIIARSNEEATAVAQVLSEFFTETPTGWYHARCEDEIAHFRANKGQKAEAGRKSAAARALRKQQAIDGRSTPVEQASNGAPTNQEPVTKNQEPEPVTKPRASRLAQDWSLPDDWATWAKETRPDLNIQDVADRFKDFWVAKAGKDGAKLDWQATWRNWVRNSKSIGSAAARPSTHSGFGKVNYTEGINDDGSFS